MKSLLLSLALFSILSISSQAQTFSGPIDSCYDKFDALPNDTTTYWGDGKNRYYKVTFTNPGCDNRPYKLVFFEDFLGDTLNAHYWRTHYNNFPPLDSIGSCDEDEIDALARASNLTVSGGLLHLKTAKLSAPKFFDCVNSKGDSITVSRNFSIGRVESISTGAAAEGGCFRHGRFSVRAKVPNDTMNTVGAIWFFGYAGEVDVIEVCSPECDQMQTNRHLAMRGFDKDASCSTETKLTWPEDHDIGNIHTFRIYTMEWTPFKLIISVDGVEQTTYHRFYQLNANGGVVRPLECEDFAVNTPTETWEHILYYTLFNHWMEIILSTSLYHEDPNANAGGEMLVDWVRVEQKTSASVQGSISEADSNFICFGEIKEFKVGGGIPPNTITGWTISSNLDIVSTNPAEGSISVTPKGIVNSYPGPGWIEARIANPASCFGQNIRKNFWLGNPATPQISAYKTCNFISLSIDNYSSENTYQWEVLTPGFPSFPFNNGKNLNITVSPPTQQPIPIAYRVTATNPCGNTIITSVVFTLPCNKWQLTIYPNPANEVVNVGLVNFTQDELNQGLELYLIDGNFNVKKSKPVTQFTETMDVFDVEPGNHYLFTVVNGENVISNQFIIQH